MQPPPQKKVLYKLVAFDTAGSVIPRAQFLHLWNPVAIRSHN